MLKIILYMRMHEYTFEQGVEFQSKALYISIHYVYKIWRFWQDWVDAQVPLSNRV